jgi:hypothetical protein
MVFTSCYCLRLNRGGAFYGLSMVAVKPTINCIGRRLGGENFMATVRLRRTR